MLTTSLKRKSWSGILMAIALTMTILITSYPQPVAARLPAKSAIKDSRVLLRNALPIKNDLIREVQTTLEAQPRQANLKRWSSMEKDVNRVKDILTQKQDQLLASIAATDKTTATTTLTQLKTA